MSTKRLVSCVLALACALGVSLDASAGVRSSPTLSIRPLGISSIASAAKAAPSTRTTIEANAARINGEARREAMLSQLLLSRGTGANAAVRAAAAVIGLPHVAGLPVSDENEDASGFLGLTAVDSANVNGFDVEPPDQMLCAGHGVVFEGVNLALAVYGQQGQLLAGPAQTNAFFGVDPSINLSDPRCLYDSASNRWFVTMTQYNNSFTDNHIKLAVSQSGDPTGAFTIYDLNVTNDGADFLANDCPCLGDQPLIGADASGFYISTNAFGVVSFEGAQIYALSKAALAAGAAAAAVHFDQLSAMLLPSEFSFSIQPSSTPPRAAFAAGTEYLAQSMRASLLESQLAVWTINNTNLIDSNPAALTMSLAMTASESYVTPVPAKQKAGPTPLAEAAAIDNTAIGPANEQDIAPDDQRMQQLTYLNGQLWTTIDTASVSAGTPVRDAAAWFVINVSNPPGGPTASIAAQGYVAGPANSHLLYPAVTVNSRGTAALVFTLTGPTYFPSAAVWTFGASSIHRVFAAASAEDGFAAYYFNSPRWGDYSSAAVAADGSLWLATETIPGVRDTSANWGTFVVRLGN
jgi:hypothetical protein